MLTIKEIQLILEKGLQAVQQSNSRTLAFEVRTLQNELKTLGKTTGVMAEATQLSCEYYCNEIKNSLSALQ